jgi:hypothetical protein
VYNYASTRSVPFEILKKLEKISQEEIIGEKGIILSFFFPYHLHRNIGKVTEVESWAA